MKYIMKLLLVIVCLSIVYYGFVKHKKMQEFLKDNGINILLIYNPVNLSTAPNVLRAYESVLKEEGTAFRSLEITQLISLPAKKVAVNNPVIIFPDSIAQHIPIETRPWILDYLGAGGNAAVIYNAGVMNAKGQYIDDAVFSEITGLNYILYGKQKEQAYKTGYFQFCDKKSGDYFQIPRGKYDDLNILCGYSYGRLRYPAARNELTGHIDTEEIYAYSILPDRSKYPALVVRKQDKGNVLYANIPLGYLKTIGDDMPLREILRTFLFKIVKIPHLMNTPFGKGGLVINWHVDANPDYASVASAEKKHILRKTIECSIHITAGDFRDTAGDKIGFDAEGRGRQYVDILKKYGTIGCHGGWAHNWFADNIEKNLFDKEKIKFYVKKNKDSLERLISYNIDEYSAPAGAYPQPENTEVLEDLNYIAYYYTGDTGSAPNRTFAGGKMVSDKVIAFPIMSNTKYASLYEMSEAGIKSNEIEAWLVNLVDYVNENKTTRLVYSHLRDVLPQYENAFKGFLDHIESLQDENKIIVKPMSYFARFILRYLKTEYSYVQNNDKLSVILHNSEGLNDITVAIPKNKYKIIEREDLTSSEDADYYYLTVKDRVNEQNITVSIN